MEENKPYNERHILNNLYLRIFKDDVNTSDLKWHWDEEDRYIESTYPTDWKFQFDNELPINLNKQIFIPKGKIHRLIKGSGELRLMIKKL
jgi:hypothetical protein